MIGMAVSTFYSVEHRETPEAKKADADLRDRIEKIILEFSGYGYRRVTEQLRKDNFVINHKRVARIMRKEGLQCVLKRKWTVATTDSNHDRPVYPNLAKTLVLTGINQLWVADITYIRIAQGFVYLAVILDAFSRKVVGYALSREIDTELVLVALRSAIESRKPSEGCVHHSDRGVQYASKDYVDLLKKNKFQISMSRKGNCYDNAKAESFFKTLKREEVYLWDYQTFDDVQKRMQFFIEAVYNQKRLHSSLNYQSPVEFENSLAIEKQDKL
jgi:transposase InsO family protein